MLETTCRDDVSAMSGERIEIDCDDWPRCALCKMPVENFHLITTRNCLWFVAECHNAVQIVPLGDALLRTCLPDSITFTEAFGGPA